MDNITQLFVRACKTENAQKRVYSVYKRFYLAGEMSGKHKAAVLTDILSNIVDTHCPMTTNKLISEINNYQYHDMELQDRMLMIMVRQIRYNITRTSHPELRKPARFKGE